VGKTKTKVCLQCGKRKPTSKFGPDKRRGDKLKSSCRACDRVKDRERSSLPLRRYGKYKNGARRRDISFRISLDTFIKLTSQPCSYCGMFSVSGYDESLEYTFCGVDRLDSDKGYTYKNVISCCHSCNMLKGNLTYEQFLEKIKQIADNLDL